MNDKNRDWQFFYFYDWQFHTFTINNHRTNPIDWSRMFKGELYHINPRVSSFRLISEKIVNQFVRNL